jgi:hypothetical protein
MSTTRALYTYNSLRSDPEEIRILKLLPGVGDEDFSIEIVHMSVAEKPEYEALSYTCGSAEKPYEVNVTQLRPLQGARGARKRKRRSQAEKRSKPKVVLSIEPHFLPIGRNLFIALKHLRRQEDVRILWIDAICINQDDLEERSKEVARMGDIYRNARRVVVWLGEESEDSNWAISTLKRIGKDLDFWKDGERFRWKPKPGGRLEQLGANPQKIAALSSCWIAVGNLFNRSWFTRLWVLQESGLASDAIVVAGNKEIPWNIFRGALIFISSEAPGLLPEYFSQQDLERLRPFALQTASASLYMLAFLTMHTDCLDPRDRIYAILSLLNPQVASLIQPDYSRTIGDVYTDAVMAEIEVTKVLSVLALCSFPDQMCPLKQPSWVPDFSNPILFDRFNSFNILSKVTGCSQQETRYEKMSRALIIRGKLIDAISYISAPMPQDITIREAFQMCKHWEPQHAHTNEYITGGCVIEAFLTAISSSYVLNTLISKNVLVVVEDLLQEYYFALKKVKTRKQKTSKFSRAVYSYLKGQVMFRTQKGYIGVCSASAGVGDKVCVALGCKVPLLLRNASGAKGSYELGGGCFVSGLQFGDGLLGPLPCGWSCVFAQKGGYPAVEFDSLDGERTQLDPRAGPLPAGWEALNDDDKKQVIFFNNVETRMRSEFDPRFSSENLKTLGIELEDIVLV